jgi:KUP system potassium uptake protein
MTTAVAARTRPDNLRLGIAVAALGVVYGDIGTSPLYTLRECLTAHSLEPTHTNVPGVLSLVFWTILVVVTLKYIRVVMRADNHGEGGTLALLALVLRSARLSPGSSSLMVAVGMLGAALFYGDGIITPAISVLSAVEGLEVATPVFKPYVIPITIAILVMLFIVQRRGTASVGALFGPIMGIWFVTLLSWEFLRLCRSRACSLPLIRLMR